LHKKIIALACASVISIGVAGVSVSANEIEQSSGNKVYGVDDDSIRGAEVTENDGEFGNVDSSVNEQVDQVNNEIVQEKKEDKNIVYATNEGWRSWKIVSKKRSGETYGGWNFATEGRGNGGNITYSKARTVSNTLTGNVKVSKKSIDSSVGFTTGKSTTSTASYQLSAPNKKLIYTIKVRNTYNRWTVNQKRDYYVGNILSHSETATAYANKFAGFGFTYTTRNA
jgi:hypothetical protein